VLEVPCHPQALMPHHSRPATVLSVPFLVLVLPMVDLDPLAHLSCLLVLVPPVLAVPPQLGLPALVP
jgi:hypothetical protein